MLIVTCYINMSFLFEVTKKKNKSNLEKNVQNTFFIKKLV